MSIDTYSPEFRHQCLVRWVLALRVRDRIAARDFLDSWEQKHKTANSQLRQDAMSQWRRGNRGKHGDWRTGDAGA